MARVWQGDHDHNHYNNNPYSTAHPTPASQPEWTVVVQCDVSSVASQVLRPGAGTVAGWLLPSPLLTPTFTLFKAASCAPPVQCPVTCGQHSPHCMQRDHLLLGWMRAWNSHEKLLFIHKHYTNLFEIVARMLVCVVNGEIISDLSCHVSPKHVFQNFFYILLKIIVKLRQREM